MTATTSSTGARATRLKDLSPFAAGIIIAIGVVTFAAMQFRWYQTIQWEKPELAQLISRGEEGVEPLFSEQEALTLAAMLQDTVTEGYRPETAERRIRWRPRREPEWVLGTKLGTRVDGALTVTVTARRQGDEAPAREWTQVIASPDAAEARIRAYGERIAAELAAPGGSSL